MIIEEANFIKVPTLDSAWREVMWLCVRNGKDFLVKGGSYMGQIRKQLEHVTIVIEQPGTRPLAPILPPGIPAPTSDSKIEAYFSRYIAGSKLADNEVYSYGQFIVQQYDRIVDLLIKSKGNTNQATIAIGDASTTDLDDPPCLRSISFKVVEGKLNMVVYFRSWDLYSGLPENLGGLQLLKELLLFDLQHSFDVQDGPIIAFSDGLHIYEQYFQIVDTLNVDKIQVGAQALADKEKFVATEGV